MDYSDGKILSELGAIGICQGISRPTESDYSEAKDIIDTLQYMVGEYEIKYLQLIIQAFETKEPIPDSEFIEAKEIIKHVLAKWDDY